MTKGRAVTRKLEMSAEDMRRAMEPLARILNTPSLSNQVLSPMMVSNLARASLAMDRAVGNESAVAIALRALVKQHGGKMDDTKRGFEFPTPEAEAAYTKGSLEVLSQIESTSIPVMAWDEYAAALTAFGLTLAQQWFVAPIFVDHPYEYAENDDESDNETQQTKETSVE